MGVDHHRYNLYLVIRRDLSECGDLRRGLIVGGINWEQNRVEEQWINKRPADLIWKF